MLTIGQIIIIAVLGLLGVIITIMFFVCDDTGYGIVSGVITLIVVLGLIFGLRWYNTSTAQGIRNFRTYESNMKNGNGIERSIDIYNADGELRFHYDGVIDIDDQGDSFTLFFDTQEGQRYIIHYGIQDLVVIQDVK